MMGGRKIAATLTGGTEVRSMSKGYLQRDILLLHCCENRLLTNTQREPGMAVTQWGMHYSQQHKILK
jgi:hypothetical protein